MTTSRFFNRQSRERKRGLSSRDSCRAAGEPSSECVDRWRPADRVRVCHLVGVCVCAMLHARCNTKKRVTTKRVTPKNNVYFADPLASTRHIAAKYDNASHALAPNVLLPRNRDGTRLRLTSAVDDAIIATARARISLPRGSCALLQSCSSHATSSCMRVNVRGRRPVKGSHSSAAPRSMESHIVIVATRRGVNC